MMDENLQKEFLGKLIEDSKAVTVFLMNGVKLQGTIKNYDASGVLLEYKGCGQWIYRHAISTIMPVVSNGAPTALAPAKA